MTGDNFSHIVGALSAFAESDYFRVFVVIGGALGLLVAGVRLVNAAREYRDRSLGRRIAVQLEKGSGISAFTAEDVTAAIRFYVEPSCTQTDPSDEKDLRSVVALAPLFKSVDAYLSSGGDKRHLIILADSGMGKTSFCLNYFSRDAKKTNERSNVVIVPLGRGGALEQIRSVQSKREKVIFLDAFDEDPGAIGNKHQRLVELMNAAAEFRNIVVTCRSQFFENDDTIPKGSGVMYVGPRRAGVGGELPLYRLFIAPLSSDQIEVFIRRNFPLSSIESYWHRRKARALVAAVPELSVRPMLLELLPDLVRDPRRIYELYELYAFLVEKWVLREKGWVEPGQLHEISMEIAVVLLGKQQAGRGDRLAPDELARVAKDHKLPIEDWQLKSRSLLNRDIAGNFKFAHRSILEFFIVEGIVRGDVRCLELEWTDLMTDLLVSWGSASESNSSRLAKMISEEPALRRRLYSLASPLPSPSLRSASTVKDALRSRSISRRHKRSIPEVWRNSQYRVATIGGSVQSHAFRIEDGTHGLIWLINDTSLMDDPVDRGIFREGYSSVARMKPGLRLPSVEEVIALWESEAYLCQAAGIGKIFDTREVYWLGDATDAGMLCCSFGAESLSGHPLRLVGSRTLQGGASFWVYELLAKHGSVGGKSYSAMVAAIVDES